MVSDACVVILSKIWEWCSVMNARHGKHVVCAGYFSNSDKRLEALDKRSCLYCEHGQSSPAILAFLRELCRMRRALSVMYGEGFGNCQTMSRRLGNDPTHHPCRHLRCTIFSHLQAFGRGRICHQDVSWILSQVPDIQGAKDT